MKKLKKALSLSLALILSLLALAVPVSALSIASGDAEEFEKTKDFASIFNKDHLIRASADPVGATIIEIGGEEDPDYGFDVLVFLFPENTTLTPTGSWEWTGDSDLGAIGGEQNTVTLTGADIYYFGLWMTDTISGTPGMAQLYAKVADSSQSSTPITPTTPSTPAETKTASPTNDKLAVDGVEQTPTVYKIGGSNYFKIRDIAAMLNGTGKQFAVGYAGGRVTVTSGRPYEATGKELAGAPGSAKDASRSNDVIVIDGMEASLTVYKIGGSNYFKPRDLGEALNFYVGWEAGRGVYIETGKPYSK